MSLPFFVIINPQKQISHPGLPLKSMEIRELREGDEYGIRALFELVFEKELHEEEWLWKYRFSPWGSASTVALKDGLIIAHYGGVRVEFCQGQKTYMAYQICDVMTHPKYRAMFLARKGAMVKAAKLFESTKPMDFAFGFPNVRHARLSALELGGEGYRPTIMFYKTISEPKVKKSLLLAVEHGWDNIKEQEIDVLWNEIRDDYSLTINKTSRYIFWRYRDCPTRRYELLTFRSRLTGRLKAYAVVAVRADEMFLFDFFRENSFSAEAFFSEFEAVACKRNAKRLRLWINPSEALCGLLLSIGYIQQQGIPLACRIMNKDVPLTSDFIFQNYCYRMGDYDAS